MKKFFTVLLSVILVLALASTGVFASTAWPTYNVGRGACNFSDTGFELIPSNNLAWVSFTQCNTCSGSVSFEYSSSCSSAQALVGVGNNNYQSLSVSNLSTGLYFQNNVLWVSSGVTSGSFEFSVAPSVGANQDYVNGVIFNSPNDTRQISCSFEFDSFIFNSEDIISSTPVAFSNTFHLSLPYGNAMRISSDSPFTITSRSYTVKDTTYNFQKYVRASDDFSYRVNGTYQGLVLNSSLSGNFSLSVYGSDNVLSLLVPWQPTNQNILGRATAYNYYSASPDPTASVAVGSGESFLVWYPYYANNQDTSMLNEVPMDMSITIEHSSPVFFTTYPITGNPSSGEDTYISNTSNVSDGGSSQQTDEGDGNVTVTFDNAPTAGGNHGQAPINQNNSILGVLSNLQNTLLGLFNKAIDGIHNLISLGSSFLQSVQVMFSWLPAELLVIITSGFVILLTIGVLKTLWR